MEPKQCCHDRRSRFSYARIALVLLCCLLGTCDTQAYSVLTHEAIIDSVWDGSIKPLLLQRFPNSTPDELKDAHAYAYGGAVIQDLGYYPFGSKFFSDLVHYVRSADFVQALIRDSNDVREYAFALGALAHYVADNDGHRIAVNVAEPLMYPKLARKYGKRVTYEENPADHLKTEFGFDVLEVAKGHYAPDGYRDHIGFQVAQSLLERAFQDTYSLQLRSVFSDYDLAIGSYRRAVSSLIPKATKIAWQIKKDDIEKGEPGITRRKFFYHVSRASYRKNWGSDYRTPGFGTKFLAFFIRLVPKVGPFKALSFPVPTPKTEQMFEASFNVTLEDYDRYAADEKRDGIVPIKDDNLDTGGKTSPGEYHLADKTMAELVDKLAQNPKAQVSPELRAIVIAYYSDPAPLLETKKSRKDWPRLSRELAALKFSAAAD